MTGPSIDKYQENTRQTAVYPDQRDIEYLGLGMNDEAGEVAGAIKKYLRGDYGEDELRKRVKSEAGDVLWYWVRLLDELDIEAGECMAENQLKVLSRMQENKIRGDGEER